MPEQPRKLSVRKKVLFAIVPLCGFLLVAELIARVARAPLYFESYRLLRIDQVRRGYPAIRDPLLGYAPRPLFTTDDSRWGTTVTIDADGFRSNGRSPPQGRPIVAVGDSFTFGDEVNDAESWPAALESVLEQPVKNAGVFGYSIGQAVLRAERVLETVPAEWLVIGFIPDDLRRNEYSKRYSPTPYFEVEDSQLVVHEPPAIEAISPEEQAARDLKNLLGYSALLDAVLANTLTAWWIDDEKMIRGAAPGSGAAASLLLIDRIAGSCDAQGCRLAVVLIGETADDDARAVLERARGHGALVLDLVERFEAELATEPDLRERLFRGHMTAAGNRWAAEQIAAAIRAAGQSR